MSEESKLESKTGMNKNLIIFVLAAIAVVAVVVLLLTVPKSAKADKLTQQLDLGEKYLSELNYEQAVIAYNAAIEIDPKSADAYVGLVETYIAQGEYDMAETVVGQAIEELGENDESNGVKEIEQLKRRIEALKEAEKVESTIVPTNTPIPTPEPTVEPTATPTPEPTVEPTATPTPEPTVEPTATPMPEPTVEPTATPTPAPTSTPTPTPEPTATPTPTEIPVLESTEASFDVKENGDGTVTITKYIDKAATVVVIPETIGGKKVTGIGDKAFDGFSNLVIDTIDIGGMDLGNNVLTGVTIKKVIVSSNVGKVNVSGPFDTAKVEAVEIREGVTEIAANLFQGCSLLTEIKLPDTIVSIGEEAFISCSLLASVNFPQSLTTIENKAFDGCSALVLDELEIGGMNLGNDVFTDATIKKIVMSSNTSKVNAAGPFDTALVDTIEIKRGVTKIAYGLFKRCTLLTEVNVPDTVVEIGMEAFQGCTSLKSIYIPDSVKKISSKAFDRVGEAVIYTPAGSYAEKYAINNNILYENN